jgi:hypothetical protein
MVARFLSAIVIIATLSIFSGCAHYYYQGEPPLEKNWGRSFESAKYNQMLNPEADKNLAPVVGLSGEAAEGAWKDHLKREAGAKAPTEFGVVTVRQGPI